MNELGFRSSFAGSNYRIVLEGRSDGANPLLAPDGTPLGFDADHPMGRDFEFDFALDDGNGGGRG